MLTSSKTTDLTPYAFKSLHLRLDHLTDSDIRLKQIQYLYTLSDSLRTLSVLLPTDPCTVRQIQQAFSLRFLNTLSLTFLNPAFPNGLSNIGRSVGELPCLRVLELQQNRINVELSRFFESMLRFGWGERLEELALACQPRTLKEFALALQFTSVHRRLKKLTVDIEATQYSRCNLDYGFIDVMINSFLSEGVMTAIEDLTFAIRVGSLCFAPPINLCANLRYLNHHRLTFFMQPFQFPSNIATDLNFLTLSFDTHISFHVLDSCFTALHSCERLQTFNLSCLGFLIDETSNHTLSRLTTFIRTFKPRLHLKTLDIAIPIPPSALQPLAEFISKCNISTVMLGLECEISDQLRHTVTSLIKSPVILKLPFQPSWEVLAFTNLKHLRILIPHEAAMRELLRSS
ncbi:hypothetical protein BC829DRAFT_411657, partial [Chytridium lagenaria]